MSTEIKSTKRGRPVSNTSARQARLEARAARAAAGGSIGRGRPANGDSARQQKLAERAAKMAAGEVIKRGAPKKASPISSQVAA